MVERPQLFRSTRRDIADAREKHSTSTVRVGRLTLCSLVAYKQANPGIEAAEAGKYARSAEEDCRRQALSMVSAPKMFFILNYYLAEYDFVHRRSITSLYPNPFIFSRALYLPLQHP
jgi:hypothetical protein